MSQRDSGGEHDLVLENLALVHLAIAISVGQDHDTTLRTELVEVRSPRLVVQVLAKPDPAPLVKGEGEGLLAIGLSRKGIHHEALRVRHLGDRFLGGEILEGSFLGRLGMRNRQGKQAGRKDET